MAFVIGLLTFLLVLDCVLLVLLVLIQLPKKEAGAGVAFGGAATDALFGAGSGNVLTKTTKYGAAAFFVLAILLSVLQSHFYHQGSAEFRHALEQQGSQTPGLPPAAAPSAGAPATPEAPIATGTNPGINLLMPATNPTGAPPASPPQ
jgi:preprotein translocase subunit SecG